MQGQKNGLRGAVPSTAGTGAEAGPWATMAGQAGGGRAGGAPRMGNVLQSDSSAMNSIAEPRTNG